MPLHKLQESELREYCKRYIESLELWLRRLIDNVLTDNFGADYFSKTLDNGANLVSKKIISDIQTRISEDPQRYPRLIDACLLENEIKIITNPYLYDNYFKDVFKNGFPEGREELLTFLSRLVDPRNKLYHANPISVREAERIICYSNDVIDCIKDYYHHNNMTQEFNVPLFIKYSDSFGNQIHREQFGKTLAGFASVNLSKNKDCYLRPGDRISLEVEVDPTFASDEYSLFWNYDVENSIDKTRIDVLITEKDIGEIFSVSCTLLGKKSWHRLNGMDDKLVATFKVLPNI